MHWPYIWWLIQAVKRVVLYAALIIFCIDYSTAESLQQLLNLLPKIYLALVEMDGAEEMFRNPSSSQQVIDS
jgi:hypothetical protein